MSAKSDLEQALKEAYAEEARIQMKLTAQDKAVKEAVSGRDKLLEISKQNHLEIIALKELMIIESGIPGNIYRLRRELLRTKKSVGNENITVAKKKALDSEIERIIAELQKTCPHTLLLSYDGYAGSYLNDYADARYGIRKCVICDLTESSKSTREDTYEVLDDKEGRLAKRDLRKSEENWKTKKDPWQPLNYFFEAFRRSAGSINVEWPVMKNGKITEESDCFLRAET